MNDPLAYNFEDAFYGPLGEYARRNEERVEIDNLSLFVQFLAVVGNVIGRRAYTKGGPDRHNPNFFTLIVGDTTIGKGGSGTVATELGNAIDPGFEKRTAYNVGSARALVKLVSDGLKKTEKRSTKDGEREYVKVIQEEVTDKRLLLFFSEMRAMLVAQSRNGATLKDELKNVWDGRTIENNTKDGLDRATNPHIGLIGHITTYDLNELATRADVGNGYFNRFIITVAERKRSLPFTVEPPDCRDLLAQIAGAIEALGPVNQHEKLLDWADDARDEWAAFYSAVKQGRHPFMAGIQELGGRICPQTKRVALIYATLDGESAIHLRHLRAAKAVVLEALNRSRHLFVPSKKLSSLPEKQSDISEELRHAFANHAGEWTKTMMHEETGKRHKASDLEAAAATFVEAGEWIVREGKAGNGHDSKFWSLATTQTEALPAEDALPEIEEPPPDSTPVDVTGESATPLTMSIDDDDVVDVIDKQGMALECLAPFTVTKDAHALRIGGGLTTNGVKRGDRGFLVRACRRSPSYGQTHERLTRDGYKAVVIGDQLLHVKRVILDFDEPATISA